MEFPNTEPKRRGMYVRNVHPANRGRIDDGLVLQVSGTLEEDDTVSVQTGRGSTVYGPAANWQPIERRPEWLAALELENGSPHPARVTSSGADYVTGIVG